MTKQLKCELVKTPFDENPEICETLFTFAVPTDTSSKVKNINIFKNETYMSNTQFTIS